MWASRKCVYVAAFFFACAGAAPRLRATTVVSNVSNVDPFGHTLYILGQAVSFTTGPAASHLDSVSARVVNGSPGGGDFAAAIWSDVAGHPGAVVRVSPPVFSNAQSPLLAFDEAGLPLAPLTTYWVELRTTASVAYWAETLLTSESSAYGWVTGDAAVATTAPWEPYTYGPSHPIGRFAIDATILPEPTSTVPVAAGFAFAAPGVLRRSRGKGRRSAGACLARFGAG